MDGGRAKSVFLDALERGPDERPAFLDEACAGDGALRERVERLLAADASADTWLGDAGGPREMVARDAGEALDDRTGWQAPVGRFAREARAAAGDVLAAVGRDGTPGAAAVDLGPGDAVGPYRLVEEIGRGGFGTVFRAAQERPVRREVALKIVTLGMDTAAVMARFEAERQTLALMDHPHIARVLDAGSTSTGRPYFVMELVDGVPVTTFCARRALPLRDRLLLFTTICRAVQHAHQKGVIHRDIKPGNVLVAEVDGVPVPKVIDFGIAKATGPGVLGSTALTREGHVVGTPTCMSPEQLTPGADVDTRADVYALGALLYEMLAGRPPFDPAGRSFTELQRLVLEADPPRPSRVAREATQERPRGRRRASVAARPGGAGTAGPLPDDLDWIVLRCLEKDRARRYPTAFALALDVERFLDERPVEAAPPSTWYRVRKLARRHRAASTAAAAVLAALILGVAGTTRGLLAARRANEQLGRSNRALADANVLLERTNAELGRANAELGRTNLALDDALEAARVEAESARQAEHAATEAARAAETQAHIAREVLDFLTDDLLAAAAPSAAKGRGRDVRVVEVLETASRRLDLAVADGGHLEGMPLVEAAVRHAVGRTYLELGLDEPSAEPLERAVSLRRDHLGPDARATLASRRALGILHLETGRLDEAEAILSDVSARDRVALGPGDPDALATRRALGRVLLEQGRHDEAGELLEAAREASLARHGPLDRASLEATAQLGLLAVMEGRDEEALALLREAYEGRRQMLGPDDPDTLASALNVANLLQNLGRTGEAEVLYAEAADLFAASMGDDHPDTLSARHGLARLRFRTGRFDVAEDELRDLLARSRDVLGPAHSETLSVGVSLGRVLEMQQRLDEAEALYRHAWELARSTWGPGHLHTLRPGKALASVLSMQERLDECEPIMRELLAVEEDRFGPRDPRTIGSLRNLAIVALARGDRDEAGELFERALGASRESAGPGARVTLAIQGDLAAYHDECGRWVEAERLARDVVERLATQVPATSLELAVARVRLGSALTGLERLAEHVLAEAFEVLDGHYRGHWRHLEVHEKLVNLHEAWGREAGRQHWQERLDALGGGWDG